MDKKFKIYSNCQLVYETPDDGYSYFFGYYDKSPLDRSSQKMLVHRVSFDGREVRDGDIAEVGFFDLATNVFVKIDETLAWNWQQGSQLQWLPPDFGSKVIYNNIRNGKFVAVIYDLESGSQRIINSPIYVVHPNGKEALGINYERHYWCRHGYNYQNIKNKKWDKPYHEDDGIYKIDLIANKAELIVSIKDIVQHKKLPEFEFCNNWLEHLMYNPSGERFMFFHRWHQGGVDVSRVYTANANDGTCPFMYPDVKFYSHYWWRGVDKLSIWTYRPGKMIHGLNGIVSLARNNSILKKIYRKFKKKIPANISRKIIQQSSLIVFQDRSSKFDVIGAGKLTGNGHQVWLDNACVLCDSYQDEDNCRRLFKYQVYADSLELLGEFYSSYNDSVYRCDLHPRVSLDKELIIIDSAHELKRKVLILKM